MRNHLTIFDHANAFFDSEIKPAIADVERNQLRHDIAVSRKILAGKEELERRLVATLVNLSTEIALDRLEIRHAEERLRALCG